MFNRKARKKRKRVRKARKKARSYSKSIDQGPYRGAKIRAEDGGPPPDWPIAGFPKLAKPVPEPENGKSVADEEAASIVERAINRIKH